MFHRTSLHQKSLAQASFRWFVFTDFGKTLTNREIKCLEVGFDIIHPSNILVFGLLTNCGMTSLT